MTARDSTENWGLAKANLTAGPRSSAQAEDEEDALKPSAGIQLRKEFVLEREVKRAAVYVCGLGHYELQVLSASRSAPSCSRPFGVYVSTSNASA